MQPWSRTGSWVERLRTATSWRTCGRGRRLAVGKCRRRLYLVRRWIVPRSLLTYFRGERRWKVQHATEKQKTLLTKDFRLNIWSKGNVKYQEAFQDRTWAAAPAERTGIEPAPSGWRLRRGSRWASRRGRSRCPSPDTLSLWPETQPGLIWGQILEEDNKSSDDVGENKWEQISQTADSLMEQDVRHDAVQSRRRIWVSEWENTTFPFTLLRLAVPSQPGR